MKPCPSLIIEAGAGLLFVCGYLAGVMYTPHRSQSSIDALEVGKTSRGGSAATAAVTASGGVLDIIASIRLFILSFFNVFFYQKFTYFEDDACISVVSNTT